MRRDNISFDIRYIHSGAVGMLLHINGKYTIGKLKYTIGDGYQDYAGKT
jgi:hypothetical protein